MLKNNKKSKHGIPGKHNQMLTAQMHILILMLLFCFQATASMAGDLLLFYSNDVHGEMAPCG